MQISGAIGPVGKAVNGNTNIPVLLDNQGNLLVSEYHGQYYNAAYNGGIPGNMFGVANQAAVTTTAALNTTWTGLSVANPTGSGVNLEMLYMTVGQFAVGAAGAVGYMTGIGASAGSLTARNAVVGGKTSSAVCSAGSTLGGTPVLEEVIGSIGSLATTGYGLMPGLIGDLRGKIIIPPGAFIASYTTVATTTALIFGFKWLEVPI